MESKRARHVLVVEDEPRMARALARFFSGEGFEVDVRRSVADACEALEERSRWSAFVVDVGLPDGDGLDWLGDARARGHDAPALVLTARTDPGTLRRTQLRAAQFLPKPPARPNLRAFAEWVTREDLDHTSVLDAAVAQVASRWGLSPRELETVGLAASGVARGELAEALGVQETTVRTLIRRALQKSGHDKLGTLVREIHRTVFTRSE